MNSRFDRWAPKVSEEEKAKRKSFGEEIKSIRLENNLSINDAAKLANVTPELLLRVELGSVSPEGVPKLKTRFINNVRNEQKFIIV